ncbi:MAG: hypothetical protein AAGE18_17100 [Pseudomonadota bacterium]
MSEKPAKTPKTRPSADAVEEKRDRLKAALRANLMRRKSQARQRKDREPDAGE